MRSGRSFALSRGVTLKRDEQMTRFGDGWIISQRGGFTPCPWAFELAHFTPARPGDRVLDLGVGAGALLLAIHQIYPDLATLVGIEQDERTALQARRNFVLQGQTNSTVIVGDIRDTPAHPSFDIVVSNPPFYPEGWGRTSKDERTARSTHALNGDVGDFVRVAAQSIVPQGQIIFLFDGSRVRDVLVAFGEAGLTVKAIRFLEDDRGQPARVLIRGALGGTGVLVEHQAYTRLDKEKSKEEGPLN
jgi:tRNA1Val (adenine37-N6)-methyltransferase